MALWYAVQLGRCCELFFWLKRRRAYVRPTRRARRRTPNGLWAARCPSNTFRVSLKYQFVFAQEREVVMVHQYPNIFYNSKSLYKRHMLRYAPHYIICSLAAARARHPFRPAQTQCLALRDVPAGNTWVPRPGLARRVLLAGGRRGSGRCSRSAFVAVGGRRGRLRQRGESRRQRSRWRYLLWRQCLVMIRSRRSRLRYYCLRWFRLR